MSETIQILRGIDPATNQDERFGKHGDFDTEWIKGEDIRKAAVEDTQSVQTTLENLTRENIELRRALRTSRRRTTNQRRELRRLAKLDELHQARLDLANLRTDFVRTDYRRANNELRERVSVLEKELNDTENQLLNTRIKLVEANSKKRGWFRK